MTHYRQNNGTFHVRLPAVHWLSPVSGVELSADNAERYGYLPAENYPNEYGAWLIESGTYLQSINQAYSDAVIQLVADTPDFERESWPKQELEARAWLSDNVSPTPYIDVMSAARGVQREYLIGKIVEKADMYKQAHALLTGQRQAKEDALNALDKSTATHLDVFAIDCVYSTEV